MIKNKIETGSKATNNIDLYFTVLPVNSPIIPLIISWYKEQQCLEEL